MFVNRFVQIASLTSNIILKPIVRDKYNFCQLFIHQRRCNNIADLFQNKKESYSQNRFKKELKTEANSKDLKNPDTTTSSASKNIKTEKLVEKDFKNPNAASSSGTKTVKNEELLEKHIAGLSTDLYQKNRVYKNDFLKVLAKIIKEHNYSSKKQGLLMLSCCTELLPDESPYSRLSLAEEVWNAIKPHTKFTVEHYNHLLKIYIANNRTVNASSFIKLMSPVTPDLETYELILECLGEAGDTNQATEVLSNMKVNGFPATEKVFSALIIGQGKSGNLKGISEILSAMKSLRINPTVTIHTAIARAYAWNIKNVELLQEMEQTRLDGIKFDEKHIMDIVKTAAAVSNYAPVSKILKYLPEETLRKPSISPYMQSVTTQLVFQNQPLIALEIYKCLPLPAFGPKDDQGLHGRSLVRDCVKAGLPSGVIALVTQELMATGRNPLAIQNAAEAALQLGKTVLATDLYMRMKQMGMPLRPHYFWPIILQSLKTYGEKGIMNSLQTMTSMDVTPDYETIMTYVLPHVSFTSPQNLMKKLLETGLTVSQVLTPMIVTLAGTGQLRAASELCELFKGKLDGEKLLKPILKGYLVSMDTQYLVCLLKNISEQSTEKNTDWVGKFLCTFLQHNKNDVNARGFLEILKVIEKANLKISGSAAGICTGYIPDSSDREIADQIKYILAKITDDNLVDAGDMLVIQMPHPKNMNEESLKAHLIELEAKGMNTRGVLRKLLQEYCRTGNWTAAREILDKCYKEGVHLSAGMKAAIFDLHVKLDEVQQAEAALADLMRTSPNFTLDEYKVIDFAKLLVFKGMFLRAIEVLTEHAKKTKVIGGRNTSMNCWRLLDTVAQLGSADRTRTMLDTLVSLRYCTPSNVLLGPLIRVHLKDGNFDEAVKEFVRISNKYKKTPLKHELLCLILNAMSEGQSEEKFLVHEKTNGVLNKLAHTILGAVKKTHGAGDVQMTLIAALAEVGYTKTLRKVLHEPTVRFHPDALLRRCQRFADEGKVAPLFTLAECAKDLRNVDVAEIYEMILDVYHRSNRCNKAMELWEIMEEAGITPTTKFVRYFSELCKENETPLPKSIANYAKKISVEAEKQNISN